MDILAGGSHVRFAVDAGDVRALIELSETPSEVWKKTVNNVIDQPDRFLFR
ncbi:MAG: hypothetical protein J7K88_09595 [Candidatus Fermentibacteraceae bacterium]|nr:hypothetical protein [Candidatus Fermentibacteraceae bacterium]